MIVAVDGARLAATHTRGADGSAVIGLHGASDGVRQHFLLRRLHQTVPQTGIGVVTFDRRGEGESTGSPSVGHFELQADDAVALANSLSVPRIGFWGFSQGAWVAPLAARKLQSTEFLVLVSAAAVTPARQMEFAAAEHLRRAGYSTDVVDHVVGLRQRFAAWASGADDANLGSDFAKDENEAWWPLSFLHPELPDEEQRREWHEEMSFNPLPAFAGIDVPTLVFYGTDDVWVPVDESVAKWREIGGSNVDIELIDGASHDMLIRDGELSPEYERNLQDWLRTRS